MTSETSAVRALIAQWRAEAKELDDATGGTWVEPGVKMACADELESALTGADGGPQEPVESPLAHLDMLQVDRLRAWARNIETHGADISQWGYPQFVSEECTRIADSIEAVIKATPKSGADGGDPLPPPEPK